MADKDGISYEWSIDAKMAGVDEGVKKIDAAAESTTKLHHASQGLSGAHNEAAKSTKHSSEAFHQHKYEIEGVGQAMRETKGRIMEFGEAIGAVLAFEAIEKGIDLIKEFGSEVIKAAAGEERTQKSFEINFGVEGGKEALEYAEKFSAATEFTEDQTKGFLQPLLQAGVPLKEMDKYMAAAGDTASGFKNKLEGMQVAVAALSRAELSGKIAGPQARHLNIGVPQLKQLEEYKGMSDTQLREILEKGSLTKDQLFRAIAGKDNVLGDASVEMGKTMGAKLDKFASLPERLFQEFYKSPAFADIGKRLDEILKAFDPKGEAGSAIIKSISEIGSAVVHAFDGVKIDDVVKTVVSITDGVKWVIENFDSIALGLGIALSPVIGAAAILYYGIAGLAQIFDVVTDLMADLVVWSIKLFDELTDLGSAFGDWLYDSIQAVVDIGSRLYDSAMEIGTNIWQGIKDGITAGISFVTDTISNLGNSMVGSLKDVLGIHSPSTIFEEMGAMTGEGFNIGIKKSGTDDVMRGAFAVPAPNGGRTLAGGGGGISVTIPVTVSSHPGQSAEETGRLIGEQVRSVVLPMLLDALEQAGVEAGA